MKYKTLIELFEPYADEEVGIFADYGGVYFFPVSNGNIEIAHLVEGANEPFRAKLIKEK